MVEDRFGHLLPQAKWLNLGGGHLMTRAGYDLEHTIRLIKELREKYDLEITMEPGIGRGLGNRLFDQHGGRHHRQPGHSGRWCST